MAAAPILLTILLAAAGIAPSLVARGGRGMLAALAAPLAAIGIWCLTLIPAVLRDGEVRTSWQWIAGLGIAVDLRLDVLSAVMCLVVSLLGVAVLAYSVRYFPPGDDGLPKYAGALLAFAAAMIGLVLADNLILLVICWEATGVLSYLLIAHRVRKLSSRRAASQALVVTTTGGLSLLVGVLILAHEADTATISQIVADPPGGAATTVAVVLMLIGGISKSAIVPFSFWLPGAMAAPTPASAYLHAATMVKAGIYLFIRFAPAFAALPLWTPALVVLGAVTMIVAGVVALRQRDLKLLLAYGTVSQLGLMTLLAGIGTPSALVAAVALLLAHAAFKGALFFIVGIIDTTAGTRDLTELSAVGRQRPVLATMAVLAAASMAGLPLTLGFVAKEAAYSAAIDGTGGATAWAMAVGAVATTAYSARFCWAAFATKPTLPPTELRPLSAWTTVPTGILVAAGLIGGLWPGPLDAFLVRLGAPAGGLAVWHGWGMPLAFTTCSVALGLGWVVVQDRIERRRGGRADPGRGAGTVYRVLTAAVDVLAVRVTYSTQRGSLPVSLGAIALVLIVYPGAALIRSGLEPGPTVLAATPFQGVLVMAIAGLAVAALRARSPLAAFLVVGGVGYAIAVYFVLRGAPDLALTQVLVETVTLIAAVLVILRMPRAVMTAPKPPAVSRLVRVVLAGGVGLVVTVLAVMIPGQRRAQPVIADRLGEIAEQGGGHNIVNVILVDTRGWDTYGEISVLVAAAIGVSSLIFLRNPRTSPRRGGVAPVPSASPWLASDDVSRHSLLLEVATRLIFHIIVIFSLYVLFVGHEAPGGGFAAGLIGGIALTLRYLAGGRHELGEAAPVDAGVVMGTGLVVATLSALAGLIADSAALTSVSLAIDVPVLGDVRMSTATLFDIGVYIVVIGMVLEVLRSVGSELDRQAGPESTRQEPVREAPPRSGGVRGGAR